MDNIFSKAGFLPADIMLPANADYRKWSVIACDQYTSDRKYWDELYSYVGEEPSALKMILPEYLIGKSDTDMYIKSTNDAMCSYIESGIFTEYKNSMIFTEREQTNGRIRKGLIGMIDLEKYEFEKGSRSPVRATEGTVLERIPPRVKIRHNAPLEMPHILMLCDDPEGSLIETVENAAKNIKPLYDFKLFPSDQRITGKLLSENALHAAESGLSKLMERKAPFLFAVGDGNHSLATAKTCYELQKKNGVDEAQLNKSRYALVELVNIHEDALEFEPIHRLVLTELSKLREKAAELKGECGYVYKCVTRSGDDTLILKGEKGLLPVAVLQDFLDTIEAEIDYIHGEKALNKLAAEKDGVGIFLEAMDKNLLFPSVDRRGCLPRKTFSLGEADDKRYYIEARKIRADI